MNVVPATATPCLPIAMAVTLAVAQFGETRPGQPRLTVGAMSTTRPPSSPAGGGSSRVGSDANGQQATGNCPTRRMACGVSAGTGARLPLRAVRG
jgi:hypothetical protein